MRVSTRTVYIFTFLWFQGVIFSALSSTRFRPDINTMQELVNTNLTLGVHNRDVRLFNKSLTPEHYAKLENRMQIFNDQKIKEFIDKREFQYALLIRQSDATFIRSKPANLHNGRSVFYMVQDCPVPCFIVYGARYGCPYLPKINFILMNLFQAGILQHWSATEDFPLQKKISAALKQRNPLSMDNIREVFYVLLVGMFLSVITFVAEIVIHHETLAYLKLFLKTLVGRLQRLNFRR